MLIIRDRRVSEDRWLHVPEGGGAEVAGDDGPVTVTLADWRLHRRALRRRAPPTGVRLGGGDDLDAVVPDLDAIDLVVFEFGAFTDGRAYSRARILRERHGYRGEIRAAGDVARDQLAFLERCGFDAFALRPGVDPEEALAAFDEITGAYQRAVDCVPARAEGRA